MYNTSFIMPYILTLTGLDFPRGSPCAMWMWRPSRKRGPWGVTPGKYFWNSKLLHASFSAISVKGKWFIEKESEGSPRLGRDLNNNSLLLICSRQQLHFLLFVSTVYNYINFCQEKTTPK